MLTRHLTLHKNLRYIAFSAFFILFLRVGSAQIVLNNATPNQMVANLVGPGIIYSNVTFTGNPAIAAGIFTNGASSNLGMNSGVVLTCGSINLIPGNNSGFEGVDNTGSAIPELNIIAGATTFDGVILEFDFIPLSPTINVNYIFGSEEYNEFVNSGYNDAFAFFISGPGIPAPVNIATVGGLPVTIDNINSFTNPGFFVNNENNFAANAIEYDGFTTTLTATRTVIPCSTYHIKLMIADGGDPIYDSGVFIQENGLFAAGNVTQVAVQPAYNFGTGIEGCLGSQFVFTMPFTPTVNTTFNYTVGGTATPGQDYIPIPNSVTIPAGQTTATVPVTIINDGIAEGAETITLTIQTSPCSTETFTLTINDPTPLSVNPTGNAFCQGQGPVNISAVPNGGNGTISLAWNNGAGNGSPVSVNPANTTVYTVTATDQCGQTATANATVTVTPPPTSAFTVNSPICQGSSSNFTYTGNAGVGATYNWNFGGGSASPGGQVQGPHSVTFPGSGTYNASLTVTQNGCTSGTTNQSVTVNPSPAGPVLGSNSPVCVGNSINLTANTVPGASYFWSGPNGFVSNSEDPVIGNASIAMSGAYSAYMVVAGCTSATSTINVLVNPSPAAPVIGSNAPICQGSTLNLSGNTIPGATYYWTGPAAFASNLEDPSIANSTTAMSGTYNAYVVVAGCTSSTSNLNVLINPLPASPIIASNTPVCEGNTLNLTANTIPGAGYFWSGPNAFVSNLEDPSLPNASLLMGGNYSAYVVVSGCTSAVSQTSVVINPTPAAPVIDSNSPICEGNTLNLTSNTIANASYVWSGPGAFASTVEDPVILNASPAQSGNYNAYVIVAGCTSATSTENVLINPIPAAPQISSNTPICEGETLNLSANTIPSAAYYWTGPTGFNSNLEDPSINNASQTQAGNYDAYVVVSGCTSAVSTTTVTINPIPAAPVLASNSPICEGETLNLSANTVAGASYNWSGPNGYVSNLEDPSIANATPIMSGLYDAYIVENGCTSTTSTIQVVINPTPAAPVINSNSPVCLGTDINLSADNVAGASYFWTGPNAYTSNDEDPVIANADLSMSGNYDAYIVVNSCTSATSSIAVSVNDIPTSDFAVTPQICLGEDAFALYNGNAPANATYTWTASNGAVLTGSGQGPITILWNTAGIQTVNLTVGINGCESLPTTQQINVIQTIIPDAGPDQTLCSGSLIQVGAANQPAANYTWLTPNGITDPASENTSATWLNNGNTQITFNITLQAETQGCIATDDAEITVLPIPEPSIANVAAQCFNGNSFDFTAGGTYLPTATFDWTFTNGNPASSIAEDPQNINFLQPGTHDVTLVITQGLCVSEPATIQVNVVPGPTAAFSYQPGQGCVPLQVTFSDQSQPAGTPLTYQWNFGNGASSSDATPSTTYTEAGSYTVSLTVEDAVGCTSTLTQPNIINVSPAPIAGFSVNPMIIYIDEPFTNVYDGSLGGVSTWNYTLSNGAQYNIPNFSVNFADTGTYVITQTVTGEFGCSDMASLSVQVLPVSVLFIPNSFTPNGNDVLNNTFLPVGGNISEFKMYIFNRWGELVFTTLDINVGWNGKIRNSEKDAKQDVYVYRIDYLDHRGNAQQRLGNVTLIR